MAEKIIKKKRKSNIELLRIICTFMVICLHMLNPAVIGGIKYAKLSGSAEGYAFTNWIFCLSIVAVDIFILISGYFMIENNKRKLGKALNLLFVCGIYGLIKYLVINLLAGNTITVENILYSLFPKSYYVFLYCTLYIISPYINRIVSGMDEKNYRRLLIVGFVLFCLWPTLIDGYRIINGRNLTEVFTIARSGNDGGFTIVNFVYMYLVGGYLKKFGFHFKKKGTKYIELAVSIGCSVLTCTISMLVPKLSGTNGILGYETVFVVIQAVTLFDFFTRIDIGSSSFINFLAKSSFGVFLLHTTVILIMMKWIDVRGMFSGDFLSIVLCWLILLVGSFIVSAAFDILAHFVMTPVSNIWSKTKLFNFDSGDFAKQEK